MSTHIQDSAPSPLPPRALPDPGESIPRFAVPTLAVFFSSLAVFGFGTWIALAGLAPTWVTIVLNTVACFAMFTVVHDASHYSISRNRRVNTIFGRVAMLFVSSALSFVSFCYIHIEHHRYANEDDKDPDTFASHGSWWQLPVRWALLDVSYVPFYIRRLRTRPSPEVIETVALLVLTVAGLVWAVASGNIWIVAAVYFIPQRISVLFLGWWFDWLPHHGLQATQRENRYRATRIRVGMEWLLTPAMFSQNYHLVHHLHPSVPFYRYIKTWRRNEDAYLVRDVAIGTYYGVQLTTDQFRDRQGLPRTNDVQPTLDFHPIPVAVVENITSDCVAVTFDVPAELREEFRFVPGQHVRVQATIDGTRVRRNYSICTTDGESRLQIAVKAIPGGAFSTYANDRLRPGDLLELGPPTGEFAHRPDPRVAQKYVGFAAGSGITPILSIIAITLGTEPDSHFTLVYGNQTVESTMFRAELDALEVRYAGRLEIVHVLSREKNASSGAFSGRIDAAKLAVWFQGALVPATVDRWFLCGPVELVGSIRDTLAEFDVDPERVNFEVFHAPVDAAAVNQAEFRAASVDFRLRGSDHSTELSPGETLLDSALALRSDTPYACMGGACGTCKAKLVSGTVSMDSDYALRQSEVDAGYILTCQSRPTSAEVRIDFDS
ncbi:fatty acid desaturase [Rhodococcus erythropolis]|uniref:fatty acid desaturase n=1 Tax=Rhodococcus erythropolis TaxID=1833 RepID=UPI001E587835|nr:MULTISPECIES: fatty acid desaturase [Rhodococcus erythropolis group]MCD2107138.1 fatty acid desaturase [Rhodococcus qingshengii]MCZ4526567.1 fatty acid desaturase [Rhodococcus erythropolis]